MLRPADQLRPDDVKRLDAVFDVFSEVAAAWRLKEALREVYASSDASEAALALDVWFQLVARADVAEFKTLSKMVGWWRDEILNHFTYKITNAYAEGVTNRVKVIKRQAYGLPNVANFEDRILVQCGLPRAMRIPA